MLIDTHSHVSKEYYSDIDKIIKNAYDFNVKKIIISGCDRNGILEGLEIIKKYNNVYMTIGFHPDEIDNFDLTTIEWLKEVFLSNKKIIGVGEIGLDYYYGKDSKEEQKNLFIRQLELAKELNCPVVIHSREAIQDTIDILKKFNLRGIIHCFSGSLEVAKEYIKLGYYLGIGGVLTFKNSKLYEVINEISLENIVLETDSPYLSPEPYRGDQNEPKNIKFVAEKISSIKKVKLLEVENITTNNVLSLFDLNQQL